MKLSAVRAIPIALAVAVAALLVSGIPQLEDAHHGLDYVLGEIAWLVFLAAALAVVVLSAVAIARRVRRSETA
jgi:Mn2+/Fe2+ NRAMP family transporter